MQRRIDPTTLFAVILAGGSGTRFWPLSRESCPKQMLQIVGEDTLLRQTVSRIQGFVPSDHIWIVTTAERAEDIRFHVNALEPRIEEIKIITEPAGRNTAAAIGLAATCLHRQCPGSVMMVMPSDHAIPDREKFLGDMELAVQGASDDFLVTFGIRPTRPETGYGYIKIGRSEKSSPLRKVARFIEKPDFPTAKAFLSEGNYFWNSGIFVWKSSKILSEIKSHLPRLYATLQEMDGTETGGGDWSKRYAELEPVSIDRGVLEASRDVWMIPGRFRWSDLGSWAALDEVTEKDPANNILRGNAVDIDSRNSIVFSDKRLVATIGLRDMVVVDTPDATLVVPKERTQDVRKIVDLLKQAGREEHLTHQTVERPWGNYTVLQRGEGYKVKRIVVRPGGRLSLQRHSRRSEHWVVVSGAARITREDEVYLLQRNESTFIPLKAKHRLENSSKESLHIIEVQSGDYVEEDDIERFDDDYNRV